MKFVERGPKDGRKMSLGDACIMMFYGRPENVNLQDALYKIYYYNIIKVYFHRNTRK